MQRLLRESSPESIQQQLLEAKTMRVEAQGIANKARLVIESGDDKTTMLNSMLDSITSRAEEVEAGMVSRERHVKIWKESIEKDTSNLQVKEEEFSNLLAEHKARILREMN